jgi:putative ABC transport system permease protein
MVLQDIRFAVRLLLKQPYFSLVALLTMALGMGVSAALFSVIDAALLRPLPYPNPSELVTADVRERYSGREPATYAPSLQDVRAWRELGTVFSHIGSGRVGGFTPLIVDAGAPERLTVGSASEDFLETYGVAPLLGRGITAEDTREGAPPVALLGHGYWRSRLGTDPNVVGRTLRIDDVPATIIGVLPAGFYRETSVWRAQRYPTWTVPMRGSGTPVVGRLKPGVTVAQAVQVLDGVTMPRGPATAANVVLQSLYDEETSGYWSTLQTLAGAVGLLLVIACVNVAGLLIARGFTRQPELAIRASLGASRVRLVRQMLTESLILAMAGSAIGLLVAWATLDSLVALIPLRLPANSPVRIDILVMASTLVLCAVTAILSGLAPALWFSRRRSLSSAASANRAVGTAMSARLGHLLVAGEVALALVLLGGSGLLIKSFSRLVSVDLGYDPATILTMEVEPLDRSAAVRSTYYADLTRALAALPEVAAAGAIDRLALLGGRSFTSHIADTGASIDGPYRTVLPGYFESLAVRPLVGRLFTDADRAAGETVIINAAAAARFFPDGPIGHTLQTSGKRARHLRIVGVVPELRHGGPTGRTGPAIYVLPNPYETETPGALTIVLRARDGARISRQQIVATGNAIGPRVLVGDIRLGSDILDAQIAQPRHRMILLTLLGGFGLLLTLVGIFGVTAYAVARRTREIGIRLALGASSGRVVRNVARDIVWPILIGLLAGLAGAQAATRVVASFLFETTPHDPMTFTIIVGLVGLAAGLAAWIPARRAAAVDPIVALRTE